MISTKSHTAIIFNTIATGMISLVLLSTGCAKTGKFSTITLPSTNQGTDIPQDQDQDNSGQDVTLPSDPEPAPISIPEDTAYKMQALAWESSKYPERTDWSKYLQSIILNEWSSLLPGADDIETFCPKYNSLDNDQRANAWAQLFVAITKYESGYSPVSRMQETTMGKDPVTGKPVYSEGLLQLSYQDVQWAPFCQFDWQKDKSLSSTSPKKTILDPYINLHCGVGIMAKQIKNKGRIVVSSGVYWAVIKSGGKYQKIDSIASIVRSLPLCK